MQKGMITLAVLCVLLGLYFSVKSPTTVTDTPNSNAPHQTKSEPSVEVQPSPNFAGQDPFKKFLDEKPNNPSSSVKPENAKDIPIQAGEDPFKEFLEKQKQNSKDQVVSPFGKN